MARKQSIGELRAWFVPSVANIAAPTVAEIGAGTDLTPFLRRDGLAIPRAANAVDASDVSSLDNKQSVGTRDVGPATLTCYRDSVPGSDIAWSVLTEDTSGFLVVRRFGGSTTAAAATQKCEVYPVTVGSRAPADVAENENQRFVATLMITSQTNLNAAIT